MDSSNQVTPSPEPVLSPPTPESLATQSSESTQLSSPTPSEKAKKKVQWPLLIVFILIWAGIGFFAWKYGYVSGLYEVYLHKTHQDTMSFAPTYSPLPSQQPSSSIVPINEDHGEASMLKPVTVGDYEIDVRLSDKCKSSSGACAEQTPIYLRNVSSNTEIPFITVTNLNMDHGGVIYRKGYVFYMTGEANNAVLSMAVDAKNSQVLYKGSIFSYTVSPDASPVILVSFDENGSQVNTIPINYPTQLTTVPFDEKQCSPNEPQSMNVWPREWEKVGSQDYDYDLWGYANVQYGDCFWKVQHQDDQIIYYPIPVNANIYAFNTENHYAIYLDEPFFFDDQDFQDWKKTHPTLTLYLYNVLDQTSKKITAFSSDSDFVVGDAKWLNNTTLEYPTQNGTATYKIQ